MAKKARAKEKEMWIRCVPAAELAGVTPARISQLVGERAFKMTTKYGVLLLWRPDVERYAMSRNPNIGKRRTASGW